MPVQDRLPNMIKILVKLYHKPFSLIATITVARHQNLGHPFKICLNNLCSDCAQLQGALSVIIKSDGLELVASDTTLEMLTC